MKQTTFRFCNEIRQSADARKTIAIINSRALDRHGTVIDPDGVDLTAYNSNPVFLINHDYDRLAGNGAVVRKQDGKLIAEIDDAAWDSEDPEIMKWFRKLKNGILKMTSIGFTYDVNDVEDEEREINGATVSVPVIKRSELLEFSFVTVGSNPEALVLSRELRAGSIMEELEALKKTNREIMKLVENLPTNEYIRALLENTEPRQAATVEPVIPEQPAAMVAVDRSALIKDYAEKRIKEILGKR